jgi:two-component system sensor histidine kinase UhpB
VIGPAPVLRHFRAGKLWSSVRLSPGSLFWRIFLVNAGLMTTGAVIMTITPGNDLQSASPHQLGLLTAGLGVLLIANILLLRFSLRPLLRLTRLMQRIDLLRPGDRLGVAGPSELNVVLSTFNDMLDRLERERQLSSSRSLGREEDERRRLASELHDQVGQGLTALLLQLKAALVEAPRSVREDLLEAQAIARANLDEVRRIARRLRPTVLDDLGLPYALLSLADATEEQTGVALERRVETSVPRLSDGAELALYRIAQEALTNAVRHAEATRIELLLEAADSGRVALTIEDDGRGMIYAPTVEGGGIRGMRERALAAGIAFSIRSRPGGGTIVSADLTAGR